MSEHFNMQHMVEKGYVEVSPGVWAKPSSPVFKPTKKHKYGAVSKDVDGVHYDSQREYKFKTLLDINKIPYIMKEEYVLQNKFMYGEETIRAIKIIPDFTIYGRSGRVAILDIKGMILPDFKIKVKMLKKHLLSYMGLNIPVIMPTNKDEMNQAIRDILLLI